MNISTDNPILRIASGVVSALAHWRGELAVRAELSEMSDLELKDMGITRNDIEAVADGSFVDARGGFRHVSIKNGTNGLRGVGSRAAA